MWQGGAAARSRHCASWIAWAPVNDRYSLCHPATLCTCTTLPGLMCDAAARLQLPARNVAASSASPAAPAARLGAQRTRALQPAHLVPSIHFQQTGCATAVVGPVGNRPRAPVTAAAPLLPPQGVLQQPGTRREVLQTTQGPAWPARPERNRCFWLPKMLPLHRLSCCWPSSQHTCGCRSTVEAERCGLRRTPPRGGRRPPRPGVPWRRPGKLKGCHGLQEAPTRIEWQGQAHKHAAAHTAAATKAGPPHGLRRARPARERRPPPPPWAACARAAARCPPPRCPPRPAGAGAARTRAPTSAHTARTAAGAGSPSPLALLALAPPAGAQVGRPAAPPPGPARAPASPARTRR